VNVRDLILSFFVFASLGLACSDDDGPGATTSSSSNGAGGGGHASTTSSGAAGAGASGAGGSGANGGGGNGNGGSAGCPVCSPPTEAGTPTNPNIDETSGMATSAVHASAFYVHNDSGDSARFFATNVNGDDLGTYNVTNAKAVDWEDMSRGPCADKKQSCLYFGDIGDNNEERNDYVVYRVAEPATLAAGSTSVTAEAFPFQYPDGSQNAEAMMVHPTTGSVYIVTKSMSKAKLYELLPPLDSASKATAVLRGAVTVPGLVKLVTAADFDEDAGVFLRTYTNVFYYPPKANGSVPQALVETPCDLPAPNETQGEAIAAAPGGFFRTLGEGKGEPIFSSVCSAR
jgi:hypothetical protein